MKARFTLLLLLVISNLFLAQKITGGEEKINWFSVLNVQSSLDIASIVNSIRDDYDSPTSHYQDPIFSYGFDVEAGHQPLSWLALSGGIRYHYSIPNHHLLYYTANSYFFINNPRDLDFTFISFKYGKQFNHSQTNHSDFFRLGIGKIESFIYKRLGQKVELFIEHHSLRDKNNSLFIGLSYGITLIGNKKI